MRSLVLGLALGLLCALPTRAQTNGAFYNQDELRQIVEGHRSHLDDLPDVYYDYHVLENDRGNTVLARNAFYKIIGDGDSEQGKRRSLLVELINRRLMSEVEIGDTLIVPTEWELDFRAYAPFPRYYLGARALPKLFIIHKTIQAWAAYENGELMRWGPVNTGAKESPTPTGRYNFNWKEPYRVSSLSPEDEPWDMYWVFNIHNERGVHVHQYAFPTGGPTSHGCVRLIDADAQFVYNWADPWTTTNGTGYASSQARIIAPGTTVLVLGEDPADRPHPFTFRRRYPVLMNVELPADPFSVPPGTDQQKRWDRERTRSASRR